MGITIGLALTIILLASNSLVKCGSDWKEDPDFIFEGKNLLKLQGEEVINFTKSDASQDGYVIFFGTDWCGHCKKFKPVFLNLSNLLTERETGRRPAFIFNLIENDDYNTRLFRLTGYPSIIYIRSLRIWKFVGKRNVEEITQWIDSIDNNEDWTEYPDRPLTFYEDLKEWAGRSQGAVRKMYKKSPIGFFSIISVIVLLFSVCGICCYHVINDDEELDHRKEFKAKKLR